MFRVICIFDGDTVLDYFDINMSLLLDHERSAKREFRPGFFIQREADDNNMKNVSHSQQSEVLSFGHVAKTSFNIKKLLQKLEKMSIKYKMLQVD
jgi:hypothetical protein